MRFAVSNIAWPREQDAAVAGVLSEFGIEGIEIAPTKIWANPLTATDAEIADYRQFWNERGIAIVAAQALLFGKPELTVFESAETRQRTLEYLVGIVRLCARHGAGALVFGSPKNRRIDELAKPEAQRIAIEFFTRLGEIAENSGTCIAMEANPPEYGADFVTRSSEAIDLVETVNRSGFRLHLDTGCMTLANDPIGATFDRGLALMKHFHVSEPNLDPPGSSGRVDHEAFALELQRKGYSGWVSLEMREPKPFTLEGFASAIGWLRSTYRQHPSPSPSTKRGGEPVSPPSILGKGAGGLGSSASRRAAG